MLVEIKEFANSVRCWPSLKSQTATVVSATTKLETNARLPALSR